MLLPLSRHSDTNCPYDFIGGYTRNGNTLTNLI